MALSGLLQEAPLGLGEPFSPSGHRFPFVSGFFFLFHGIASVGFTVFAGYDD